MWFNLGYVETEAKIPMQLIENSFIIIKFDIIWNLYNTFYN